MAENETKQELTLEHAIAEVPSQSVAITPMHMLQMAVEQGADLDKMEKLMGLQERWEANEAKKAFVLAMADFKSETIEILKDKKVDYKNKTGGRTQYSHASLHGVVTAATPLLSKHGLSHTWKTSQGEGGVITVSCVLTHKDGHSEETALSAGPDQSGGKNNIQAVASTVSYLERYTFLAATGLSTKDQDDDANSAEPEETITEDQEVDLIALMTEVDANQFKFLGHFDIKEIGHLPASEYARAVAMLKAKRKEAESK